MLKVRDKSVPSLPFSRTFIQPVLRLKITEGGEKNIRMEDRQNNCKMLSPGHDAAIAILSIWELELPVLGFHRLSLLTVNHKQEKSS